MPLKQKFKHLQEMWTDAVKVIKKPKLKSVPVGGQCNLRLGRVFFEPNSSYNSNV